MNSMPLRLEGNDEGGACLDGVGMVDDDMFGLTLLSKVKDLIVTRMSRESELIDFKINLRIGTKYRQLALVEKFSTT
jgi:hypothetical protein